MINVWVDALLSQKMMNNISSQVCRFSRWYSFQVFVCVGYATCLSIHYQKTDKYKWKYRGNIFVDKFLRDFTDGNIPSVYTEGITVGKKIKTKQKNDDVSGFTNGILSVNSVDKSVGKLVYTIHHVNYKGNHRRTKSVGIFQRAPELFTFQLHCYLLFFTDKIIDGMKSCRCYLAVLWKNSIDLKFSFKYYRRNRRRTEKLSVIVGGFWKLFMKLKI